MRARSSVRPLCVVPALLLAAAACRTVAPPTGTPLGPQESLILGVEREHDAFGVRQAELVATSEQIAADVARLTGAAGGSLLFVDDPANATALPAASFAPVRHELVAGVTRACRARGFRVVGPGDPDVERADFSLLSEVHGFGSGDRSFTVSYVVAAGACRRQPASALFGTIRASGE